MVNAVEQVLERAKTIALDEGLDSVNCGAVLCALAEATPTTLNQNLRRTTNVRGCLSFYWRVGSINPKPSQDVRDGLSYLRHSGLPQSAESFLYSMLRSSEVFRRLANYSGIYVNGVESKLERELPIPEEETAQSL